MWLTRTARSFTKCKQAGDAYTSSNFYFVSAELPTFAGTAAQCDKTTATISSQLEMHRLNTGGQAGRGRGGKQAGQADALPLPVAHWHLPHHGWGGCDWGSPIRDFCPWLQEQGPLLHHGLGHTGRHVRVGEQVGGQLLDPFHDHGHCQIVAGNERGGREAAG